MPSWTEAEGAYLSEESKGWNYFMWFREIYMQEEVTHSGNCVR